MLKAQIETTQSPAPQAAGEVLEHLEHAGLLGQPTRAYYRLRSQCYQMLDEKGKALEDEKRTEDARTPWSATDHFLLGEHRRTAPVGRDAQADPLATPPRPDLAPAVEQYRAALRIDPQHFWSRLQLGRCCLAMGRSAEAVEILGACVALEPGSPWAYNARGLALALERRYDEAIADLDRALKLQPAFHPAKLNRGWVHWRQGKEDKAISDFQQVLQSPEKKRLIQAAYYLGSMRLQQGQYAEALKCFQQFAEETKPSAPASRVLREAYKSLAAAHYLLGQDEAGARELDKLLELVAGPAFDAASPDACYHRGRFLLRHVAMRASDVKLPARAHKRILELALAEFRKAETGRPSADLYYEAGLALEKLRRIKEAIAEYSKGLELAPDNLKLLNKRGYAYVLLNQYDLAMADYSRGARAEPQEPEEQILLPEAHTWLGYFKARRNEGRAAEREAACALLALSNVDRSQKEIYEILHNMACIYGELSKSDEEQRTHLQDLALALLKRAVQEAKLRGSTPEELRNIEVEEAFDPPLRARPEFQQLLQQGNRGA